MATDSLHLNLLAAVAAAARPDLDRISTGSADARAARISEERPHVSRFCNRAARSALVAIALAAGLAATGATAASASPRSTAVTSCALGFPARPPAHKVVVPILMYHRVNVVTASTPASSRALSVHPAAFARQMRWLSRNGYHTITQQQLFAALMCGRSLPRRPVMLTFDDGYRDVFFNASRVLLREHMCATAYVVTDRISGPDISFLTWNL